MASECLNSKGGANLQANASANSATNANLQTSSNADKNANSGLNSNAENSAVELFEIAPKVPYTKADLDWTNERSRTTIECKDKASRPKLARRADISDFDAIFIGFPVWWYTAPHIVLSFLESADFGGKIVVPFCTSGGSDLDPAPRDMQKSAPNAIFRQGRRFNFGENRATIRKWLESLNLV